MAIRNLSAAYFVNEIEIPNISGTTPLDLANLKKLNIFIAKYEPLYLTRLLGTDLYAAYAAGIADPSPAAKWVNLNNKINYTDAVLTALGTGISPAANYIYFKFMRSNWSTTLQNSEGQAGHENFTKFTPKLKMIEAWNECVRLSDEIQAWLRDNIATYPEYDTIATDLSVSPDSFLPINQFGI